MDFIRMATIAFSESEVRIEGETRVSVMEKEDSGFIRHAFALTFYRPAGELSDRDWLKDMLVQVIEQL